MTIKIIKTTIMKKLFIAALLAVTVATSAFAADASKVNALVLHSFKADFKKASRRSNSFCVVVRVVTESKI